MRTVSTSYVSPNTSPTLLLTAAVSVPIFLNDMSARTLSISHTSPNTSSTLLPTAATNGLLFPEEKSARTVSTRHPLSGSGPTLTLLNVHRLHFSYQKLLQSKPKSQASRDLKSTEVPSDQSFKVNQSAKQSLPSKSKPAAVTISLNPKN